MALYSLGGVELFVPDVLLRDGIGDRLSEGTYERAEHAALRATLKPGQRLLDLGSGLGFLAAVAAQITRSENIVTVEVNPHLLRLIRGNLDKNNGANARLLHGAVVGPNFEGDTIAFRSARMFLSSAIVEGESVMKRRIRDVPALRLAELLKDHPANVIQMDIEGAEQHLFDEALPSHVGRINIEFHPKKYGRWRKRRLIAKIMKQGFRRDETLESGNVFSFSRP